ncbi:hypothetical protein V8E55_005784 [Tylopilus felleus]
MASYGLTRRAFKLFGILVLSCVAVLLYIRWHDVVATFLGPRLPPMYEKVRAKENSLPHYKEYERTTVKYFLAANHYQKSGWGNVMQDYVMMALLAHTTNRSFVFNDYVWKPNGSLYSDFNGKLIPSRIPLSALSGGPVVGGPWPPGDQTPRSVSREFFHKVCPNPTVLSTSIINTEDMRWNDDIPASYIFEKWVEKINSMDDPCLMLDPNSPPIFEYWIYGNKKRLLSIWPYLSASPSTTHWDWSPLVYDAFRRNRHLFEPTKATFLGGLFDSDGDDTSSPVPGLLAIHVRRGDFQDHCVHLSKWNADWNAFNAFPEFYDRFDPPAEVDVYIRRCYPTIEQIVDKVGQVQKEATEPLRYVYIMTNGPTPWVEELETALARNMTWDHVGSSRNLKLTWEHKFISQAVDMYIAQRAQVFIGNGWSSLTSNVVMLRMAKGFEPNTNRFF